MAYQGWKHGADGKKIDWDKVKMGGGEPCPAGQHEAKVLEATPQETKAGQPMIKVKMEIVGSDNDDAIGRKLFDNWVLTQEGLFRLKQFCAAVDTEGPETVAYDDVDAFCSKIANMVVPVNVRNTTFEGNPQAKVNWYGTERPSDEKNGNGNGHGRDEERRPTREAARKRR